MTVANHSIAPITSIIVPKRPAPASSSGLPLSDPRRPVKVRRLAEERQRIPAFLDREPLLKDPDFEAWESSVALLLEEIFGTTEFLKRFRQLRFRPIAYSMMAPPQWYSDPRQAWTSSLNLADKVLRDALEEAAIELPEIPTLSPPASATPSIVVNVSNQNVFSPEIHVTIAQLLDRVDSLPLSDQERSIAKEHLQELRDETEGAKRWPIIAKSLEGLKSLGKSVYKEVAIPLIVEFLKRESGLGGNV